MRDAYEWLSDWRSHVISAVRIKAGQASPCDTGPLKRQVEPSDTSREPRRSPTLPGETADGLVQMEVADSLRQKAISHPQRRDRCFPGQRLHSRMFARMPR